MGTDVKVTQETVCITDKTASISQQNKKKKSPFGFSPLYLHSFMLKDMHDSAGVIYPAFNTLIFFFLINNENVNCIALSCKHFW